MDWKLFRFISTFSLKAIYHILTFILHIQYIPYIHHILGTITFYTLLH